MNFVFIFLLPAAIVVFNWVVFALILFGLAIVFDPLGSSKYKKGRDNNDNTGPTESALHRKVIFINLFFFFTFQNDDNK